MRKIIASIIFIAVVAAFGITAQQLTSDNIPQKEFAENNNINSSVVSNEAESLQTDADDIINKNNKVYTPTFMYFVAYSDENYSQTQKMLDTLMKEYSDRVTFDIINIDDNPEAKENFPVDRQTPALIMLNTSNDISAFEFKCDDKATLISDIENALNG